MPATSPKSDHAPAPADLTTAPALPTTAGTSRLGSSRFGPVALVIAAGVSVQFGAALAVMIMPGAGAAGVVTLRLAAAALVLLLVCRPKVAGTRAPTGARSSPSASPWPA